MMRKFFSIVLLVILTSCFQSSPPERELLLPQAEATAKAALPQGLVGIDLLSFEEGESQGFSEVGGLSFTSGVFSNFTVIAENKLYITATYGLQVPVEMTNLSFIAVDVDGSNIADTAVSALTSTSPSSDDDIAKAILPSHGMTDNAGVAIVDNNKADFQALYEAEAASIQNNAKSAVSNVFPYGFVVRCNSAVTACSNSRTIPPGIVDAGVVSFAFVIDTNVTDIANLSSLVLTFIYTTDTETRMTESVAEQGTTQAETRADDLALDTPIRLLGTSATTASGNPTGRLCQLRTAGTAAAPTVFLVNHPATIFVDARASGLNNGSSWINAFSRLGDALAIAHPLCSTEIWVAEGVYYPDEAAAQIDNDRLATFQLLDGIAIYGGFTGTENDKSLADPEINLTILSGDLDQNDGNKVNDIVTDPAGLTGSNAYHVVTGSGTDASAILDGFVITAGLANGSDFDATGAGIFNAAGSPGIKQTRIQGNLASLAGGGMASFGASTASLTEVTFIANNGGFAGGGLQNGNDANTSLKQVRFERNRATSGAGMSIVRAAPLLFNVHFVNNTATSNGGGIFVEDASPSLNQVVLVNNRAQAGGGIFTTDASPTIRHASFVNNSVSGNGAGLFNDATSAATTQNSLFWGNRMNTSLNNIGGSLGTLQHNFFENASSTSVDGSGNVRSQFDPLLDSSTPLGIDGISGTADDGMQLVNNAFAIDAGDNNLIPLDHLDVDANSNSSESLPSDILGNPRQVDDTGIGDTGSGTVPLLDIGAYEKQTVSPAACSHPVLYVNQSAAGLSNGNSWTNAFTTLQDALACVSAGQEIWVASGVYYPDEGVSQIDNERSATFQLVNGIGIYGGFDGSEVSRDAADPLANPTILSGDIDQDDSQAPIISEISTVTGNSTNSFHVVTGSGTDSTALLDGFTITAGFADGAFSDDRGGGMTNDTGSPTLKRLHLIGNHANVAGGALYSANSSSMLSFVQFEGNRSNDRGGAIFNNSDSNISITHSHLLRNTASNGGGGMYNNGSSPHVSQSIMFGNTASDGGAIYNVNSMSIFRNVTLLNNIASGRGGVMYSRFDNSCASADCPSPAIVNSIFLNNPDSAGTRPIVNAPNFFDEKPSPGLAFNYFDTDFPAGSTDNGGNLTNQPDPFADSADPDGADNMPGTSDDGLQLADNVAAIDAGRNSLVAEDGFDLDDDDVSTEKVPFDITLNSRFVDDASVADGGTLVETTMSEIVDMGAYEKQRDSTIIEVSISSSDTSSDDTNIADTASFTVSRSGSTDEALFVNVQLSGSATVDADYTLRVSAGSLQISGSQALLRFPAGISSIDITLTAIEDGLSEVNETAVIEITPGGYTIGNPSSSVTISSDYFEASIMVIDANVDEDLPSDTASFTITRTGSTTASLDIHLSLSGSASADTDYSLHGGGISLSGNSANLTMPVGQTSVTIMLSSLHDVVPEGSETATLTLAPGTYTIASNSQASATIIDADSCPGGTIAYVDASVAGTGKGSSWLLAFQNLQEALAADYIAACGITQIWVAKGVYYPDEGGRQTNNDTASLFRLRNGVAVYGGFNGNETMLSQANPSVNLSILSGDIDQNDSATNDIVWDTANINGSNAVHVVSGFQTDNSAILSGFVITAGDAGGGNGGGLINNSGSPSLRELQFIGNKATHGGAIHNRAASPRLSSVIFMNNQATDTFGRGGAIFNEGIDNGIGPRNPSNATITNALFIGNTAYQGGAIYTIASDPTISHSNFVRNTSLMRGGGIFNDGFLLGDGELHGDGHPVISNSIFWDNTTFYEFPGVGLVLIDESIYNIWDEDGGFEGASSTLQSSYLSDLGGEGTIDGGGNLFNQTDPFRNSSNPAGADALLGTSDDGLGLAAGTAAINAGKNSLIPLDKNDLDDDGDRAEVMPVDIIGNARIISTVDMGAYEMP